MNSNIDIGQPEFLLLCGAYLIANNFFGLGLTLLILGILGSIFRSALRIQKIQEENKARERLLNEMSNAGEEFGKLLASLFGIGSNADAGKNSRGIIH